MSVAVEYVFEWDPAKAGQNERKHGVSFEQAATVLKDPRAISVYDTGHSKREDRWITLGFSADRGLLVVCHTFEWAGPSAARIRIFSCRKATRRESRQYVE
jgi:uncharacterized DUF497 family protein